MSDRYEFLIPMVNLGLMDGMTTWPPNSELGDANAFNRDLIDFEIDGIALQLRQLIVTEEGVEATDVYYSRVFAKGESPQIKKAYHAQLEIGLDYCNDEKASELAEDVTWLLALALGQTVTWTDVGKRVGDKFQIIRKRAVRSPMKASGRSPISGQGNQEIQSFLQNAYPVFKQNPDWWRVTIDWFTLGYDTAMTEVSCMIHSMLLDRLGAKILESHNFGRLIGEDLDEKLSSTSQQKEFKQKLATLMSEYTENWSADKNAQILATILRWNKEPSYGKKIATICEMLILKELPKGLPKLRHSLLHTGQVSSKQQERLSIYHDEINRSVVLILMRMFGYTGYVFLGDLRLVQMKDFMEEPN